ncbi:zinc finger MYND domain-containing protein [Rhodotorula paludigena]|uniref:zinc finger MYND domain-containing protein n=1 Tax=Rhodotorula paludigena TaxID=86838 RepID=UPI003171E83A
MPSDAAEQPCVVCGTPTTQRCSGCAQRQIGLFFCSRAHQKLVWSAHKLVCSKDLDALLPPLNDDEVEDAKARMHQPLRCEGGRVSTLARDVQILCNCPLPEVLSYRPGPIFGSSQPPFKPLLVLMIRSSRLASFAAPLDVTASYGTPVVFLLASTYVEHALFALHDARLLPSSSPAAGRLDAETWFSPLLHRALVLGALELVALSRSNALRECAEYVAGLETMQRWVRAGMGTDREAFRQALKGVDFTVGRVNYHAPAR